MTPSDAGLIELIMAAISVTFIAPAAVYAYRLRGKIIKALIVMAVSRALYVRLFLVMTFASAIAATHLAAHVVPFMPVSRVVEFVIHLVIDSMLILVSLSLYLTFRKAYGMMEEGAAPQELERKLREAALGINARESSRKSDSVESA
jgi:hypothetical protein